MFHVQHLLGVGHQRRSAAIARALAETGVRVDYVSGGYPMPALDLGRAQLHQLAPARVSDGSFRVLEDEHGRAVDAAWKSARRDALLALASRLSPALIVTETFPFGRGLIAFELTPLVEQARRGHCHVVCSVRDIIEPRDDPRQRRRMVEWVRSHYAAVLVHGDPALLSFASAFPEAADISDKIHYTGYVTCGLPPPSVPQRARGPVLVSCGGGRVGERLLQLALAAHAQGVCNEAQWRFRTGAGMSACAVARMRAAAPPGVFIESISEGFVAALVEARLSVSQAGYNTVSEVLATGTPSVLVPYGAEREQGLRAEAMAARGLAQAIPAREATPVSLARAMAIAARADPIQHDICLDGVSRSVGIIRQMLE